MKYLLDTHVALWQLTCDPRTNSATLTSAQASGGIFFVSHVSVWEATIKANLGKLDIPEGLARILEDSGLDLLPIDIPHIEALTALPRHHSDPFDRLLVAQARVEDMTLVTHDRMISRYHVQILSV